MKNLKKIVINVSSTFFVNSSDSIPRCDRSRIITGLESAVLSRRRGLGHPLDRLAH